VLIGAITLLLLVGYGVDRVSALRRAAIYIETICLSLTTFLLMAPTVSETLRRVPDDHPFVTDMKSPLLLNAHLGLFVALMVGVIAQVIFLRRCMHSGR
jgi:hypothetical protein